MSRKKIQNRIDDLEPEQDDGAGPMIISLTHFALGADVEKTYDNSPHPELTVPRHQGIRHETLVIATPNVIPEPYCNESLLSVCSCTNEEKHKADWMDDEQKPLLACELWNALSDEQLRKERQIREEKNEPIPELLAEYE